MWAQETQKLLKSQNENNTYALFQYNIIALWEPVHLGTPLYGYMFLAFKN